MEVYKGEQRRLYVKMEDIDLTGVRDVVLIIYHSNLSGGKLKYSIAAGNLIRSDIEEADYSFLLLEEETESLTPGAYNVEYKIEFNDVDKTIDKEKAGIFIIKNSQI